MIMSITPSSLIDEINGTTPVRDTCFVYELFNRRFPHDIVMFLSKLFQERCILCAKLANGPDAIDIMGVIPNDHFKVCCRDCEFELFARIWPVHENIHHLNLIPAGQPN